MSHGRRLWQAVPILLVLGACTETDTARSPQQAPDVAFNAITFEGWQEKLATYPPDIVVVDMWATWCVSCLERFPRMVEMWREFRDRRVRFVSLNLDDHEDTDALADARVLLGRFGAGFENYFLDENLMEAFARLDLVGIPAVVIYDRRGREAYRLTGDNPNRQFTDADVEAAIKQLLSEDAGEASGQLFETGEVELAERNPGAVEKLQAFSDLQR